MDISPFISSLLLDYDCVIVPGFGGFVCNYKPADIHPVKHTISPPSKAISFNTHLQHNDGLLIHFIAEKKSVSVETAAEWVNEWVQASKIFLRQQEEVTIPGVGFFKNDIENTLQFYPDVQVNYLKSSFGLRTIVVPPVIRAGKEISFTEKFSQETKQTVAPRRTWKVAAVLLMLVMLAVLAQWMYSGKQIQSLNLNQASVYNTICSVLGVQDPVIYPIPLEVEESAEADTIAEEAVMTESLPDSEETIIPPLNTEQEETYKGDEPTYYIIVGAFREERNIEAARQRLQQRFPDSSILIEKGETLTRFGYSAGHTYREALEQLQIAREQDDSTYWLLKK